MYQFANLPPRRPTPLPWLRATKSMRKVPRLESVSQPTTPVGQRGKTKFLCMMLMLMLLLPEVMGAAPAFSAFYHLGPC